MTRYQLEDLTEDELALVLYVVNVVSPPVAPKMAWEPKHLLWFRHDQLIKKLIDIFPKLKPEGHPIYVSLMQKLGICVQLNQPATPVENNTETSSSVSQTTSTEVTASEVTGSSGCPPSQSLSPDVQNITGSNGPGEPA